MIANLKEVTVVKDKRLSACFPNTVELPQLNAARRASSAAMIVLSSQSLMELEPKVTKYPPTIAANAKMINRLVIFSFRMTPARAMAKMG